MVKNLFARLRIQILYPKFRSSQNYEMIEFSSSFCSIFAHYYEFFRFLEVYLHSAFRFGGEHRG